jgi:cytidylate kinase
VVNLKLKNKMFKISCDGGAATGKSTGAKMLAKKYNLKFLSSGLLYRYASFLLITDKPKKKLSFLKKKFKKLNYNSLNKMNLHSPEISQQSAIIAKTYKIREILKTYQINFAKKHINCCIEGRDISTKIIPNSDVKFFFKCSLNTAAFRRYKELKKKDDKIKLKNVKKALSIRNNHDIERKNSPLLKHIDAIVIDTGKLNKQSMLVKMSKYVDKVIKKKYGN